MTSSRTARPRGSSLPRAIGRDASRTPTLTLTLTLDRYRLTVDDGYEYVLGIALARRVDVRGPRTVGFTNISTLAAAIAYPDEHLDWRALSGVSRPTATLD